MTAAHSIFAFYDLLNVGYLRQTKRKKKKRKETKEEVKPEREEITRNNCVHFPVVHINDISFLFFSLSFFCCVFPNYFFPPSSSIYSVLSFTTFIVTIFCLFFHPEPWNQNEEEEKKQSLIRFYLVVLESSLITLVSAVFRFIFSRKSVRPIPQEREPHRKTTDTRIYIL
jgi:uncharacterized membrane protein YkgB